MLDLFRQEKDSQLFEHKDFGKIRVIEKNGDIWFVAKEICDVLELGNSRQAVTRLDEEEKDVISNDTLGGKQEMAIINESGLYSLVLTSRKPEAKAFKKWVTSEVLPSIRKKGSYSVVGFQVPKTLPAALRLYALEIEAKEKAIQERDLAIKTKAYIGSKREATAMVTASIAKKKVLALENKLGEGKLFKTAKAIDWLTEYFEIKQGFWVTLGKQLTNISKQICAPIGKIQTPEYANPINTYHITAIAAFKELVNQDYKLLADYRIRKLKLREVK